MSTPVFGFRDLGGQRIHCSRWLWVWSWGALVFFNSLGPVQSEKRSASPCPSPALPQAACFLLCLLLPPDFLLLLLSAVRSFQKAHTHCLSRGGRGQGFVLSRRCMPPSLAQCSSLPSSSGYAVPFPGLSRALGVGDGPGRCRQQVPPYIAPTGVSCHWRHWPITPQAVDLSFWQLKALGV